MDTINQIDLSKYIMEKQEDDSILLTPFNINNFDIKHVSPRGSLILVPNSNSIDLINIPKIMGFNQENIYAYLRPILEIKSYHQKLHYIIKRFQSLNELQQKFVNTRSSLMRSKLNYNDYIGRLTDYINDREKYHKSICGDNHQKFMLNMKTEVNQKLNSELIDIEIFLQEFYKTNQ